MPESPVTNPAIPPAVQPQKGHTGYVALLGRPNTGKSTFLNTVLGCHLAAVSAKPQTTRKSMLGIYNDADSQIIFLDAPGVHPYHIALDEAMSEAVSKVTTDADIIICLIDPTRAPGQEDGMVAEIASACAKPVLLVLNKTDVSTPAQRQASLDFYQQRLQNAETYLMTASDAASNAIAHVMVVVAGKCSTRDRADDHAEVLCALHVLGIVHRNTRRADGDAVHGAHFLGLIDLACVIDVRAVHIPGIRASTQNQSRSRDSNH